MIKKHTLKMKMSDEVLRDSETLYHTLFENALDAIFILKDGVFIACNPRTLEIFGCTRGDQLLGRTPYQFSPPIQPDGQASDEKGRDKITLALQGFPQRFDWRHIRCNGSAFDAEVALNRLELSGQLFVQAIVRDVTEHKAAERALRKERDMAQKYLDIAQVIFVIIDTDQKIRLLNKMGSRILEYQPEEIIGREIYILVPERLKKEMQSNARRIFAGGIEPFQNIERHLLTKSGRGKIFAVNETLLKDDQGNITGLLVSGVDITERKQMEEELRKSEQRWRKYFELGLIGMAVYSPARTFIEANDQLCETVGYSLEELKKMSVEELDEHIYPEDRAAIRREWGRIMAGETDGYKSQMRLIRKGGKIIFVNFSAKCVRDPGGSVLFFLVLIQDITQQKKAEESLQKAHDELEAKVAERTRELTQANLRLQELDRLKSMFIASMSHELRTPLNSIIGFASILLDEWIGPLTDEQKNNLSIVLRSGQHLLALINDVIDVSKIEAGQLEPFLEEFDLDEVIAEAATFLSKQIHQKNLQFKVESVHQMMYTDKRRLLQCLLNLTSNATKFTDEGCICLQAHMVGYGHQPMVEISVFDTGIGIEEKDLSKLFSSFSRIESPARKKVPGTGLGLYLTRKLVVEILQGHLSVKSEYGVGSTFTITIPVRIEYHGEAKNVSK